MGIANFPFPSFTLLLTSDRVVIPGPSYVFKFAPLGDNNMHEEECYPLANLDFENDSIMEVALVHCDSEEFTDDVTETISMSTGSVPRTVAVCGQTEEEVGVGIKFHFPSLKMRPSARFRLKSLLRRFSRSKLNRD